MSGTAGAFGFAGALFLGAAVLGFRLRGAAFGWVITTPFTAHPRYGASCLTDYATVRLVTVSESAADHISLLFHGNAPWAGTGYGTQAGLFGPLLHEQLGYRLAFSAFYGLRGAKQRWPAKSGVAYDIYPGAKNVYGNDVLVAHAMDWFEGGLGKGLVITLTDPWVLDPKVCAQLPVLAWTPIDHNPIMPRTLDWFHRSGATPLAMAEFGVEIMRDAGLDPLYVPHGYDPEVFTPLGDRAEVRELLGLPKDAFIVGMVAANQGFPSRKGFCQAIQAFAQLKENIPEAVLYLHTLMEPDDGENLYAMCNSLGVVPMVSDQYKYATGTPAVYVAALLNCFDVLLNPAWGEGFGLTMLEAQACGTPVIGTNFSATPEVAPAAVGNWLVPGQGVWTGFDSWQKEPNVEAITWALERAYGEPDAERLMRRVSVAKHAKQYEAVTVTEKYWKPALETAINRKSWSSRRAPRP